MAIHPGDMLAGYRVTRLLGRGGMGEVWAAVNGPREVAVKVLLQRAAMKPDLVRRFEREAKITSAIKSAFVCQLLEVHRTEDGTHLLVFEHLTGESLSDRLKREQYLPFTEVWPIIEDVLEGLVAAHAAGVIHRDLKPGNIFIERTGDPKRPERAKVLDFGISKITGHKKEEPTLTAFDATLGSFAYMAPEQIRGAARADERADIYAVGAVAFRALAGRLPFEGSSAAVLVSLKLDRNAPSLAEATGEKWPGGVERFLEKALARHREKRFETASEALDAWRAIQPANITKVKLPPSQTVARKSPPPPAASSLTFTASQAAFPEDMPTEVDDSPPTMTGAENSWGGTGRHGIPQAARARAARGSSPQGTSPPRGQAVRPPSTPPRATGAATGPKNDQPRTDQPKAGQRKQGGR